MSDDRDTIAIIVQEIGLAFTPLIDALDSPEAFADFMAELGWDINAIPTPIQNLLPPLRNLETILESGTIDVQDVAGLLDGISSFIKLVNALATQPDGLFPSTVNVTQFKNEFPGQLLQFLIVEYLLDKTPFIGTLFRFIGIIRIQELDAAGNRLAYTREEIAWSDLSNFIDDPLAVVKNAYGWGTSDLKAEDFASNLIELLEAWGMPSDFGTLDAAMLTFLANGALNPADVADWAVKMPFIEDLGSLDSFEVGLALYVLPETASDKPGFAIIPYAKGETGSEIALTDNLKLIFEFSFSLNGGVATLIRPNRPVDVRIDIIPSVGSSTTPPSTAEFSIGLLAEAADASAITLLGTSTGSRIEVGGASIKGGARINSTKKPDLYGEIEFKNAKIVIQAGGDADGFLNTLLPGEGISVDFNLMMGLSSSQGLYFGGSGGLEVNLPTHIQLGPIEIQSALIAIKLSGGVIPIELGATLKAELGPLQAIVENMGLRAELSFPPNNGGNLGPLNLGFAFKPPNGIGLSIDAGVVSGGGYLFFDFDKQEYAGVLQLDLAKIVTVTAIGLITTRMPDGSKGFSLLIIITAEFATGIQLGFGFTLLGVGGLLGLNRTMNLQALAEGVRNGALNNIMFPHDVIANAPRIISDLRNFFPPENGKFLIGPMVKLGWGTPTLVSLSLGIIIEIPGNIAIVGILRVALPADDAALIVLQVSFIGALEFDKSRVWFFATLFESRVLFFTIEGDMGLLMAFGDDANFVLSVGGFHPLFNPPPLPFPSPRRISFSILSNPVQRIRVEGYFAVTSNTVQFGAKAEIVLGFDDFGLQGHIAFDVLIQFSPFYFIAQISASVSLKAFGVGLFSVRLSFALSGPSGWRARGSGSISLLFFEISADFDISWGESKDTSLPPISVIPILVGELNKVENWKAELPAANNLLVSLRKLDPTTDVLVLHPVGTLRVSQKALPLDLNIDKVGNQKPNDARRFTIEVSAGGLGKAGDATEQFAIAQYQNMDDATKLSRPSYQQLNSGVQLSVTGQQLNSSHAVRRIVRYEQIIIDNNFKRFRKRFSSFASALFVHFLGGAAITKSVLSVSYKTKLQPFEEKIKVAQEGYTVAYQANNKAYATSTTFTSEAAARDFMQQTIIDDPNRAEELHVIPQFEVTP